MQSYFSIWPLDDALQPGNLVIVECITEGCTEQVDLPLEEGNPVNNLVQEDSSDPEYIVPWFEGDVPVPSQNDTLSEDTSLENWTPAQDPPENQPTDDIIPGHMQNLPESEVIETLDENANKPKMNRTVHLAS